MISYEMFMRLRTLLDKEGYRLRQAASTLELDIKTVRLWSKRTQYQQCAQPKRASKLDPVKGEIVRLLHQHPFSAQQILQRLRQGGYSGGYSILKDFIRQVRPVHRPAYLTLHFEPGECAQIDWGYAGVVPVGQTRRRLSFFIMVLCYSRQMYVEFTLSETMEQFLSCQQNAFAFFGGAPRDMMLDNLKTGVLSHPMGGPVTYHPRYLDFARFYGFKVKACNVRKANEKGRVENAVGYLRKNFLNGLELTAFAPLNPMVQSWLAEVANVRVHAETKKMPKELFALEKPRLSVLPATLYDVAAVRMIRATPRFRVHFDSNRYSVPAEYASARLTVRVYPDKLVVCHQDRIVAEHTRSYDRGRDFENPDHVRELLQERKAARSQKLLQRFMQISPLAEEYYRQLEQRRLNPQQHVAKIIALSEIYGIPALAEALKDASHFQAFSSEYVANLLEQRQRLLPQPGVLHLTHSKDLLELDLPEADLRVYDQPHEEKTHEQNQ